MTTQRITSSAAKIRAWERIRELDRRALPLIAAGASIDQAYRQAMDEISCENPQNSRADR